MAIDSSLFGVNLPAGAYALGDVIPLVPIDGPANVRSGRGSAILKQIMCGKFVGSGTVYFRIHVKNSDWIDDVSSLAGDLTSATSLDDHSGLIQFGCDAELTANSGWQVWAECINGGTTTTANSLFALIDIDYPSVSAVSDPDVIKGIPTTINYDIASCPTMAHDSIESSTWSVRNVDYFKAGYKYCIQAIEMTTPAASVGFVAFSNAAGLGGLQRIIPVNYNFTSIRYKLRYASALVKGPMDVKVKLFQTTSGTSNVYMCHDYVKRSTA